MKDAIGIFDSGLGGLTVFKAIRELLPNEFLIYLGDTARVPYGTKSQETVIRYALEDASFLIKRGVKAIVVACNTASAYAIQTLKDKFDVPIIGVVEPGAKAAFDVTKNKCIGVIGTTGTINSNAYGKSLKEIESSLTVVSMSCPLFVPLVEEGWLAGEIVEAIANKYLANLKIEGIDTLILGCTHYPLLKQTLQRVMGDSVALVDSAHSCAQHLAIVLEKRELLNKGDKLDDHLYVTDLPANFENIASCFLESKMPVIKRVDL